VQNILPLFPIPACLAFFLFYINLSIIELAMFFVVVGGNFHFLECRGDFEENRENLCLCVFVSIFLTQTTLLQQQYIKRTAG
jgi:hypothetical protein